jgi:hypothetical protein
VPPAGGHLHDEQLHLEILDDDGRPLPDGEVGEVVATTFGVEAMPLIRYRTGDCAALFSRKMQMRTRDAAARPDLGRKNQKLKFKGTSLFPSTLRRCWKKPRAWRICDHLSRARKANCPMRLKFCFMAALRRTTFARGDPGARKNRPQIRHAPRAEIEALQMPPAGAEAAHLCGFAMKFASSSRALQPPATVAAVALRRRRRNFARCWSWTTARRSRCRNCRAARSSGWKKIPARARRCAGFQRARELGFTHAITMDADGQHFAEDLPKFLAVAQAQPDAHWLWACAIFSPPAARRIAAARTQFPPFGSAWKPACACGDTQCGFRCYPLALTQQAEGAVGPLRV